MGQRQRETHATRLNRCLKRRGKEMQQAFCQVQLSAARLSPACATPRLNADEVAGPASQLTTTARRRKPVHRPCHPSVYVCGLARAPRWQIIQRPAQDGSRGAGRGWSAGCWEMTRSAQGCSLATPDAEAKRAGLASVARSCDGHLIGFAHISTFGRSTGC